LVACRRIDPQTNAYFTGSGEAGSARTMTITGSEVRTVPSASVASTEKTW
jgi:hypothetical protein